MKLLHRHSLSLLGLIGIGLYFVFAWHSQAYAGAGLSDKLVGSFRGAIVGPAGNISGDFAVVIERASDGFIVRWPPRQIAQFQPTARTDVYRTEGDANPLSGKTAHWARFVGDTLIVYSMQIDEHGGYDIQNYIYAPASGGLNLVIQRIRGGADPVESKGRLEKYGR